MEKMKAGGKKMLSNVKAAATGWWEKLQRFLLMTLLGSLVMAIKDNWEAIKVQIDKVVNIIKGIWEFMSPVLIPLFKALVLIGFCNSNKEAKRLISENGARVNDKIITNIEYSLKIDDFNKPLKISAGKKRHVLVTIDE